MTDLCTRVCIYACTFVWTDYLPEILNERIQVFPEDRYREEAQWRATVRHVRVQHQEPRAMMTELDARLALVCASTDDSRLLTGGTNLLSAVVDWPLQVVGYV